MKRHSLIVALRRAVNLEVSTSCQSPGGVRWGRQGRSASFAALYSANSQVHRASCSASSWRGGKGFPGLS